jgi:hypothetical protein
MEDLVKPNDIAVDASCFCYRLYELRSSHFRDDRRFDVQIVDMPAVSLTTARGVPYTGLKGEVYMRKQR